MIFLSWFILLIAAILESGGDTLIRQGLRGGSPLLMAAGAVVLICYGFFVNMVKWDLSKLLGVYVCFFAVISVLIGGFLLKETIPSSTWLGLGFIVAGGLIIQFGPR